MRANNLYCPEKFMTNCLNCENSFEGSFCNDCGQKAATHRFSMHEWLHEIPHSILHVDSGFFLTLKTLFARPGNAIREYLGGRRKLLFSPFLYVLLMCGIYVVVSYVFPKPKIEHPNFSDLNEVMNYVSKNYYKVFIPLMILPMAIGSYLAYLRSGFNFAEHLVLNCYLIGQLVIGDIILAVIASTGFEQKHQLLYFLIDFILKTPYWFWVYWQFFKPRKWYWGVLQFILSFIILNVGIMLLMNGAALILMLLKGSK